jgi:hypothetical protein
MMPPAHFIGTKSADIPDPTAGEVNQKNQHPRKGQRHYSQNDGTGMRVISTPNSL